MVTYTIYSNNEKTNNSFRVVEKKSNKVIYAIVASLALVAIQVLAPLCGTLSQLIF